MSLRKVWDPLERLFFLQHLSFTLQSSRKAGVGSWPRVQYPLLFYFLKSGRLVVIYEKQHPWIACFWILQPSSFISRSTPW